MKTDFNEDIEAKRTLPYELVRKLVTLSLVFGLLGGLVGGYVFVNYLPNLIPTSKQSVVVQENSAAVNVAKKVSPSVVSITSESTGFSFFGRAQTTKGAGTGIIVSEDGLIVTNNHVIEGAQALSVFTDDGKEYKKATVVARDTQNDLAFVRIKATGLKPAEFGDSNRVEVGTKVIAIGNALGQFQNTVTEGIISGLGRPITAGDETGAVEEQLQNLFQTDAAINPGNSGGPLVELSGKVIGINAAVAGNAQNIGFAIPINVARTDLEAVKKQGKITHPYLGVRYVPVTKELASSNNLSVSDGAYITGGGTDSAVVSRGPADKAGIREGDIITKIAGKTIDQRHSLSFLVGQRKIGETIAVTLIRGGKEMTVDVKLEEAPSQ